MTSILFDSSSRFVARREHRRRTRIDFSFRSKNGADVNQTESEHHLTPIHVLCDAEYHGQSLRVSATPTVSTFALIRSMLAKRSRGSRSLASEARRTSQSSGSKFHGADSQVMCNSERASTSTLVVHRAVIHDRPDCVEVLMDAHADSNVAYMGDTPLSIAARHNRRKIVQ